MSAPGSKPEATVKYRVVRADGLPVFWGLDREAAQATLGDREKNGEHGPYRIQKRTISEWADV